MFLEIDDNVPICVEVIGFSERWIDEDFNPNGTRVCFKHDDGTWTSAKWIDYLDTYSNDEEIFPTHYILIPEKS